ncbi:MAG: phospholipase D-like domain-containing protein [Elusimicrobia bacterium]|nr:phospholipase D-like domain-containing protein [Elusimicrobiota bacterium]
MLAPAARPRAAAVPSIASPLRVSLQSAPLLTPALGAFLPALPAPAPVPQPAPADAAVAAPLDALRALESAEDPARTAARCFDGADFSGDASGVETLSPPASAGTVVFNGAVLPVRAFSRTSRIPSALVAAIDATRRTLRLSLYELNLQDVTDAILRAQARGVDVKLIYDESHAVDNGLAQSDPLAKPSAQYRQLVRAGVDIKLLRGGGKYGIMHNKFAVFDGELIETGSFNWSVAADQRNFENAVFRKDASLAALYASYWDWMWGFALAPGQPTTPRDDDDLSALGPPPVDPHPSLRFKDRPWPRAAFSPNGGIDRRLVTAIASAERSVTVAIFSFFSPTVAEALVQARARGVEVRVIADAWQARNSPILASLFKRGVPLRLSAGRGERSVMHHKVALIDGELLVTGSFNFSVNAEKYNFENQFYSTDPGDLAAFESEFEFIWAQAHVPKPGELPSATAPVPAAFSPF